MATIEKRVRGTATKYRVKVRIKGFPAADATFDRITDAKQWAAETETAIRAGKWFQQVEAKRVTLSELIDRYEREHMAASTLATKQSRTKRLKFWRDELGSRRLADITAALVIEARAKLMKRTNRNGEPFAPATANQYVGDLHHCFTIARREFALVTENPLRDIKKLREPRGRVRFLTTDERKAVLAECRAHSDTLYTIAVIALSTGARKGEILNLRWPDMDMARGMMTFHETKNGERRTVPLVGYAIKLTTEHGKVRRLDTDLVFPGAAGRPLVVDKMFRLACARAGVKDFRFHDLRHTAASELAMNGATLAEIAEVLGHKTLSMVKRYAHLTEGHKRDVVSRMNARMFG